MGFYGKICNIIKNTITKITVNNTGKDSYDHFKAPDIEEVDIKGLTDFNLGFDSGNRWIFLNWDGRAVNIYHQGTNYSDEDQKAIPNKTSAGTSEGIIGGGTPPLLGGTIEDSPTGTSGETLENTPGETLDFKDTISLPVIYYDSTGHITKVESREFIMPDTEELNGKINECVINYNEIVGKYDTLLGDIDKTHATASENSSDIANIYSLIGVDKENPPQVFEPLLSRINKLSGDIAALRGRIDHINNILIAAESNLQGQINELKEKVDAVGRLDGAIGDGGGVQEYPKTD